MHSIKLALFFISSFCFANSLTDFCRVCFVILSNPNSRHEEILNETLNQISSEVESYGSSKPFIYPTHLKFTKPGDWTYFPLFDDLLKSTELHAKWYIFIEENSVINATSLALLLSEYDYHYDHFIGFSVDDGGIGSPVHRFTTNVIEYPDINAGFILSRNLLNALSNTISHVNRQKEWSNYYIKEFTMDAAFELAQTCRSMDGNQFLLQHEPLLCPKYQPGCAIFPRDTSCKVEKEQNLMNLMDKTLFAVKTCTKLHEERIPVLKATWLKLTKHHILVSDSSDEKFGTIVLPGAETNQIKGHCQKTEAILNYFLESQGFEWLVITDDDTIMSIGRLLELISCYDKNMNEPVSIGSTYGFRLVSQRGMTKFDDFVEGSTFGGFEYLAGGGGMVFNKVIVENFMKKMDCPCEKPDFHDDMHLGLCQQRLGIPIIRNSRFHQARPHDYNLSVLARQIPISFHKFEETDPRKVYKEWFESADKILLTRSNILNDEL